MAQEVLEELRGKGNASLAAFQQGFFKTHVGGYGEGDVFLGIKVPEIRSSVKKFKVDLDTARELLDSEFHEVRFFAIQSLVALYPNNKQAVYETYLESPGVNSWDLVDTSAPHIVGKHLLEKSDRGILDDLAVQGLWKRRIAMIATLTFIRANDFDDALRLAEFLRNDDHDLIHNAVGWMLREIGKRHEPTLTTYLDTHAAYMPRTMLRYAIEKFPNHKRKHYLGSAKSSSDS